MGAYEIHKDQLILEKKGSLHQSVKIRLSLALNAIEYIERIRLEDPGFSGEMRTDSPLGLRVYWDKGKPVYLMGLAYSPDSFGITRDYPIDIGQLMKTLTRPTGLQPLPLEMEEASA